MANEDTILDLAVDQLSQDAPNAGGPGFTCKGVRDYRVGVDVATALVRDHEWVQMPKTANPQPCIIGGKSFPSVVVEVADPDGGGKATVYRKTGTLQFTNITLGEMETLGFIPADRGYRVTWQNG